MFAVGELSYRISVRFFKCHTSGVIMLSTPIFSIQSLSTNLIYFFWVVLAISTPSGVTYWNTCGTFL